MIEKMKKVCVVASASRKEEMLAALRDLGILHLADKKAASRESTERFSDLSRARMALSEFKPEKESESGNRDGVIVLAEREVDEE